MKGLLPQNCWKISSFLFKFLLKIIRFLDITEEEADNLPVQLVTDIVHPDKPIKTWTNSAGTKKS